MSSTTESTKDDAEPQQGQNLEQENKLLRETIFQLKRELDRFRSPALMVATVLEIRGENAVIRVPNGNKFFVNIAKDLDDLSSGNTVVVEQKNLTIVNKLEDEKEIDVDQFVIIDKPSLTWDDIGGLEEQKRDLREVIELPLEKPELFKDVGIQPPKGVLLHGPPGTGKTLLAKAVAHSTDSTFIEIVGSELVQKFIGEGAKLVKKIFKLARRKAPTIIFIDEIDSVASTRVEIGTSGEREVQRTFMQLLAEIDGFEPLDNVKIIAATNRKDVLDDAVTRPGRLDRLIEVGTPDEEGIKEIFKIHTKDMKTKGLNMSKLVRKLDGKTGAQIKAVCTEAGYVAIRNDRTQLTQKDFDQAIEKIESLGDGKDGQFREMFG